MAKNNPAEDMMNPPSNMSNDYEEFNFGDLEFNELFWQTNKPKEEHIPWRKVSQTEGMNLKARTTHNFDRNTVVWQKT